jgi:LPS export ABC transporter permease LptG/LPS export ABC transporter permease LptF
MQRLNRYIFREILTPGLIALVALTFVVFSREVGKLLETIFLHKPALADILPVVAVMFPAVLAVTIPMGVLVGILTGFSRLSSDSEAIALRACGISMWRILRPVLAFGILAMSATLVLTTWAAPATRAHLRTLQAELVRKYPPFAMLPKIFLESPSSSLLLYGNETDRLLRGYQMRGILIVDTTDPDTPVVTLAESGTIALDDMNQKIQLTLFNSRRHEVTLQTTPESKCKSAPCYKIAGSPKSQDLALPFPSPATPETVPIDEVSTRELWERIQSGKVTLAERAAFHQRFALPFACIAFALMALPLGVSTSRGGRSMGLVLSLFLMFAYFLAQIGLARATTSAGFSPILGAWLPNAVFTILGLVLMTRSDRQYENRVMAFLSRGVERIFGTMAGLKLRGGEITRYAYSLQFRFRLFRLLDMYVLRGFFFFFAIVLGVFASLFIIVTLFELLPFILENKSPLSLVLLYFVFLMPQILYWVIPLAVLLAILINLGTLTKTNEILAVKAGAISLYRMSLPLILMGALLSGSVYVMQDYVLPWTNKRQDEYHDIIKNKPPQTYGDPSRKWMMGSASRLYNYSLFDPNTNSFANVSVLTLDPETFELRQWFYAKRGTWIGSGWNFEDGWVVDPSKPAREILPEAFKQRVLGDLDSPDYFKKEVREADQMNYRELEAYVADLSRSGLDVSRLTVALYRKLSFPLVSFIMVLIGIPFSFKTGRKGAFYGIGFCLAVGILYWSTFELFGKLGGINQLEPFVAAWFPNLIFGASGLWLMLRVKT